MEERARKCVCGRILKFTAVRPGECGCDGCGAEVAYLYTFHCDVCDYDLCGQCYMCLVPNTKNDIHECERVLKQLDQLCHEQVELESLAKEEEVRDAIALHDQQLVRLQLSTLLQNYKDKAPTVEDFAQKYEAEIVELAHEVHRLKDENVGLVLNACVGPGVAGLPRSTTMLPAPSESLLSTAPVAEPAAEPAPAPIRAETRISDPSSSLHSGCVNESSVAQRRRAACDMTLYFCEEVRELRKEHSEIQRRERQLRLDEWLLEGAKRGVQNTARAFRGRQRHINELSAQNEELEALLKELQDDISKKRDVLVQERRRVKQLHEKAVSFSTSSYLPLQIRKQSGMLMKFLDAEGTRRNTEKHMRGLQTVAKLYKSVQCQAPGLLPLAGLAKTSVEEEFARYRWLEENHSRLLQWLQYSLTRGILTQT